VDLQHVPADDIFFCHGDNPDRNPYSAALRFNFVGRNTLSRIKTISVECQITRQPSEIGLGMHAVANVCQPA
ncbi:MAG: hypothetical protein ACRC64_03800, partial [Plesiomonas shigelloides]